ncbi:PsiF family protein [Chitinimonas sp.]|uniref:PsiF family protein n=1 Tax=Chitinimonas sp. TaxID=1934313 RepID=UPI002F95DEEF
MKLAFLAAALLSFGLVHAADPAPAADAPNKQQSKMGQCNKDAEGKKGDERKKFMSECLKAKPAADASAKPTDQKEKMKWCNKEATGKKGDERKKFMSECLKK